MGASKERVPHLRCSAWKDGGDAGSNRSHTALKCAFALDNGGGSDAHARYVGDAIRGARGKPADADSKVGGSDISRHGGSVPSRTTLSLCCRQPSPSPALRVTACRFGISARRSCSPPRSSLLQEHSSRGGLISKSGPGPQTGSLSLPKVLQPALAAHRAPWRSRPTLPSERALRHHPSRQSIQACSYLRSPVTLCASW